MVYVYELPVVAALWRKGLNPFSHKLSVASTKGGGGEEKFYLSSKQEVFYGDIGGKRNSE